MNLFSTNLGDVRSIFINLFYPTQLIQTKFLTVPAGFLHAWARSFFRTSSCCAGFKPLICPWSLGEKGLIAPCYLWNYTSIKHVEPQNFHGQTLDNSHWNSTHSKFCLSKLSLYHRHNRSLEELTNELVIILDFLWRVVTCRRTRHMMGCFCRLAWGGNIKNREVQDWG